MFTIAQDLATFSRVWCCAGPAVLVGGLLAAYFGMRWWADRQDRRR
jgi:hypothetical protein